MKQIKVNAHFKKRNAKKLELRSSLMYNRSALILCQYV